MFLYVIMFSQRGRKLASGNEFDDTEEAKLSKISIATDGAVINLNDMQTAVNTNSSKTTFPGFGTITNTALQGSTQVGSFKNILSIKIATPIYYDMAGVYGAITGSGLAGAELATDERRIVVGSTGIVEDTESPSPVSFSESNTKVQFNWTTNVVLVFYKMEYFDDSAGERIFTFGLYDDNADVNKINIRTSINVPSATLTFKQISGFAGVIGIQSFAQYYLWAKSTGGGKIQSIELNFMRCNLNF